MKSIDENKVIDLNEDQKLSQKQASSVLKGRYPGGRGLSARSVRVLSARSVRRFCSKRSASLMDGSSKVISDYL